MAQATFSARTRVRLKGLSTRPSLSVPPKRHQLQRRSRPTRSAASGRSRRNSAQASHRVMLEANGRGARANDAGI